MAMVAASEDNVAKVARELNIYDSTLGNWVRQARDEANGAPNAENAQRSANFAASWSASNESGTFWEKQWPTSRHPTRGTRDSDVHVHR